MINKSVIYLACVLITALVVTACGLPFFKLQLQQKDLDSICASVTQTNETLNQQFQPAQLSNADLNAIAVEQTMVILNQQSQARAMAAPTSTTPMPNQNFNVMSTATLYPCNSAIMVSETYPDQTHLDINQDFNKSWRLKNVGICTWNTNYRLAFYSGNSMSASSYVNIPYAVSPGGTVDIVVPMRAPGTAGVYTGYWGLYTNAQELFGKVWVTIDAASSAPIATNPPAHCGDGVINASLGEVCDNGLLNSDTVSGACRTNCMSFNFWVTNVSLAVDPPIATVPCLIPTDVTFNISANITTSAAGTVIYHWTKGYGTMGQDLDPVNLVYTEAGTKTVTMTWEITNITIGEGEEKNYWALIYINSPNNQSFPRIDFYAHPDSCSG